MASEKGVHEISERVRKELAAQSSADREAFLASATADLKQQLRTDVVARDVELSNSRSELEQRFAAGFGERISKMEGSFDEKLAGMIKEFEQLMHQARSQWHDRWDNDVNRAAQEWAVKWLERESEWLAKEQSSASRRKEEEERFSSEYKALIDRHISKVEVALEGMGKVDIHDLEEQISKLEAAREGLNTAMEDVDGEVNKRFGEWMEKMKHSHQNAIERVKTAGKRQEDQLLEIIEKERKLHADTCAKLQAEHMKQLDIMTESVAQERRDMARAQQHLEVSLRSQYEAMVKTLQEHIEAEHQAQVGRAMDLMEKHAKEEARRSQEAAELQSRAEAVAADKFQSLLDEMHQCWEAEETERTSQLDKHLRGHYETIIQHMQKQLDTALGLHDEADKQWIADVEVRNAQQIKAMQAFEVKCRRLYEERLHEFVEKTDLDLAEYEQRLLLAGEEAAEAQREFNSRMHRMKIGCAKWRADYQQDAQAKFQGMVQALEGRYEGEATRLREQLQEAQRQLTALDTRASHAYSNAAGQLDHSAAQRQALQGLAGTKSTKSPQDEALMRRQYEARKELESLWHGMGTDSSEKVAVLEHLLSVAEPTEQLLVAYEHYTSRLGAEVPIHEALSQREALRGRLDRFRRLASQIDSLASQGQDTSAFAEEMTALGVKSHSELVTCLARDANQLSDLEDSLRKDLSVFAARFGTPFKRRGQDILEEMGREQRAQAAFSSIEERLRGISNDK